MKLNNKNRTSRIQELTPDPQIRSMLESTAPREDILPWSMAVALVDSAPAVQIPWYARLATTGRRQLAYAAMPAVLLVIIGTLWAMPAQSNYLGTIMTTSLPSTWHADSLEIAEVQQNVFIEFDSVKPQYGELYFKVTQGQDRPKLAMAMIGLDRETAQSLVAGLESRYPALQAFEENYTDVSSDLYHNRLDELVSSLQHSLQGSKWHNADEVKLHVFESMQVAGFEDIKAEVVTDEHGRVFIEIDAAFKFEVPGRTQEALNAAGLNEEVLGRQVYEQLLRELGN